MSLPYKTHSLISWMRREECSKCEKQYDEQILNPCHNCYCAYVKTLTPEATNE